MAEAATTAALNPQALIDAMAARARAADDPVLKKKRNKILLEKTTQCVC